MNIFINILVAIICLVIGYLFGSLNTSILIGKYIYHQDPRDYGSGNAGATNATRLWGRKVGNLIILLDVIKTILPMVMCWAILTFAPFTDGHGLIPTATNYYLGSSGTYIINWPVYYVAGFGVVIGHCWPVFEGFKGGKGAASFLGGVAVSTWMFGLLFFPVYLLMKKKTRIVSKSVLTTGGIAILCSWIYSILFVLQIIPVELYWLPTYGPIFMFPMWQPIFATSCYIIVVWRHRENIKRLIAGTERKIDQKL